MSSSILRSINLAIPILAVATFLYPTTIAFAENATTLTKNRCEIFKAITVNDLSINDIVVKSPQGNIACIKARFSLAIKVEAVNSPSSAPSQADASRSIEEERFVLGYLPLDTVVAVDDSCPEPKTRDNTNKAMEEPDELDMIVTFECGRLSFKFKKDEAIFMNQVKGYVRLDSNTKKDFLSQKPMLFTPDTNRHFKYNDLIEVNSEESANGFILTAHFYNMEYEAFRKTSSRDFLKPPDEDSKPLPAE